jgi:hypothetical protein
MDAAIAVSAVGAVLTAAYYGIGAGRAFGWDASNTVGHFVATPSLLDPFRFQTGFNNHVLFSALEHAVFTISGTRDERLLRVLPIAFAALAVGLVAYEVAHRLGALAGIVAAAVLAANPIAVQEFRDVRGYSLLVLSAVVSTELLLRLRQQRNGSRRLAVAYCIVAGLGVATHLTMLALLGVHLAFVARDRRSLRIWLPRVAAAVALGVAISAVPLIHSLSAHQYHVFRPWFPLTVSYDLLGGQSVAFAVLAPVVLVGLWRLRGDRDVRRAVAAAALVIVALWLAAPEGLYSRYLLWALPAVGALAGVAVARRPVLVALVVVAIAAQSVTRLPDLGEDQVPNRVAATLIRNAQGSGQRVCAVGSTATGLAAYATGYADVRTPEELTSCDLVVVADGRVDQAMVRTAARVFPYGATLRAEEPGNAFARSRALLNLGPRH